MNLQIEWWHLVGLVIALISAFWALVSLMVAQFNRGLDKRFEVIDTARAEANAAAKERFDRLEEQQRNTERELLSMKAELPDKYVRREDAIRSEMTLHAKFDGLAGQIYQFMRAKQND